MPLAFDSLTHGTVAFGFFNIESHMILLDSLFFFADDFCSAVQILAAGVDTHATIDGFRIAEPEKIGNLHGAIAGKDLSGFIGRTYERFPFPADRKGFKQSPDGHQNRNLIREMIADFGQAEQVAVRRSQSGIFSIGEFGFDRVGFTRLIAYVEQGGYPRWKDENRPPYVRSMTDTLAQFPAFVNLPVVSD